MAVPIYAIGLGDDADAKILEQFAKETGGQYYRAPNASDLSSVFRLISRQLGAEYQVSWISTTNHTSTADVPIEINIARSDDTHATASLAYAPPAFAIHTPQQVQAPAFQALREIAPALAPTEQQVFVSGILAGLGAFVLTFGIVHRRRTRALHARLAAVVSGNSMEEDRFALRSNTLDPVTAAAANVTGRFLPSNLITYLRYRLTQAGYQRDRHVGTFLATELMLGLAFSLLTYFFIQQRHLTNSPLVALGLTALAFVAGGYLPYMWLRRAADSRLKSLQRALPDALDLMVISVTAGLSLDTAMQEVVHKYQGHLSNEFNQILNEMRMGVSRRDALRNFANRTGLQDIQLLVAALLQADEMGSDISDVLSAQADQLRIRRHHMAQERARKAPIKMLLPMVGLIFPAMFAILLAAGFLQLATAFASIRHH